jgi:SAM-dependent methyltransferase
VAAGPTRSGRGVDGITVVILDRARHAALIAEVRAAGAVTGRSAGSPVPPRLLTPHSIRMDRGLMNPPARPTPAELYAHVYDLRGIAWPNELDFYMRLAAEVGPGTRVLEVACGTGRVAHPLARAGVRVTGLDISPEMLAVARATTRDAGNPRFVAGDMRTFELPDRFELAIIPAHSFQSMTSASEQLAALGRIRSHLVTGGRLVVHVNHDSLADLAEMDGVERSGQTITDPITGRRYRSGEVWTYDHAWQNATLRMAWCELDREDAVLARYELAPRVLHVPTAVELEHALRCAGFIEPTVRGGFDGSPFQADSSDMIWIARAP